MASAEFEDFNCTEFPAYNSFFTSIAILRATVGTFSALCCVLVICLIIFFKKHKFFTQRLILYLALAALIHSLSYPLARVNYYTPRPLFDPYCYFAGFFNLYSSWIEVLSLSCLTFNVFLNAVLDKWPQNVEYVYIAFTYLTPLLWTWIPFIDRTFANGDAWCDIRTSNEDCSGHEFGAIVRFILWYIPLAVVLLVLFTMALAAAYKIRKRGNIWYGPFYSNRQQTEVKLQRHVKPMVWYPIVYLFLNVFSFVNRLDVALNPGPGDSNVYLWYLHILSSPLRGAFVAIVYTLDPETRKRLTLRKLRTAAMSRGWQTAAVKSYRIVECNRGESVHRSSHHNNNINNDTANSTPFTSVAYDIM